MLKGIGVSGGIGIGKAWLYRELPLQPSPSSPSDPETERQRLEEAVRSFSNSIRDQAQLLREKAGAEESRIILGQLAIVQDPYLRSEAQRMILAGQGAECAFEAICDTFIQIFSHADDDLTRQRAADVQDVKKGILGCLAGASRSSLRDLPAGCVLVTEEITPSMLTDLPDEPLAGIITAKGSTTSHSAILARALEIPAVMSVPEVMEAISQGEEVILDGQSGMVIPSPDPMQVAHYRNQQQAYRKQQEELTAFRGAATVSADGERFSVFCNIGRAAEMEKVLQEDGEGVGLFRTEILFTEQKHLPTEEEQFQEYRHAVLLAGGRPVTIRTLDIGGDKTIPYLGLEKEENPFMGFRAIRYCLKNTALFKTQLRSILRASAFGPVSLMLPLVTCVDEVRETKRLLEVCKTELTAEKQPFDRNLPVGLMIETASAAVMAAELANEADFFSIGTNDLTGYTMACDRGNSRVSYLYSALQPSVLRLIRHTIRCAREAGLPVGMCGEAAADPRMIPLLMAFGLTEFSVSASSVLPVRRCISQWSVAKAREAAEKVMAMATEEEICRYLSTVL